MSRTIMLIPTSTSVGLTSVCTGVLRAMERKGVDVAFYKPIAQPRLDNSNHPDLTSAIIQATSDIKIGEPTSIAEAEHLIGADKTDVLLETIVERYNAVNKKLCSNFDRGYRSNT